LASTARSSTSPSRKMPAPNNNRNCAWRNGGETLSLTTFTLLSRPDDVDVTSTTHVKAHRSVELEGVAAGGGFGVAEHHADLHAQLVDEDHHIAGGVVPPFSLRIAGLIMRACSPICASPISPSSPYSGMACINRSASPTTRKVTGYRWRPSWAKAVFSAVFRRRTRYAVTVSAQRRTPTLSRLAHNCPSPDLSGFRSHRSAETDRTVPLRCSYRSRVILVQACQHLWLVIPNDVY
jgi:hypothetical protein